MRIAGQMINSALGGASWRADLPNDASAASIAAFDEIAGTTLKSVPGPAMSALMKLARCPESDSDRIVPFASSTSTDSKPKMRTFLYVWATRAICVPCVPGCRARIA